MAAAIENNVHRFQRVKSDLWLTSIPSLAYALLATANRKGGDEFFGVLSGRGFFPEELMRQAIRSTGGGMYCWPPVEHDQPRLARKVHSRGAR